MIPIRLQEIAQITGGEVRFPDGAPRDVVVDGPVVTDSREAGPGSLYVARVGEHADGHRFAGAARDAGAVAVLATREITELPYVLVEDEQAAFVALTEAVLARVPDLTVVGVTGSSGKTTTKDLLGHLLSRLGETVVNVGSLNSEVGVPLTACRVTPSTRHLVVEMGARGVGHIRYLTDMTHPRIGAVLNVGSAHLGEFGSREAIARAKSELVQSLPADGVAVLNADDPLVSAMQPAPGARIVRFGTAADADVRATDVRLDAGGRAGFTLYARGDSADVQLRLLGDYQVSNALAAAAVALELGMGVSDVAAALGEAGPASRWRMEVHERADGVTVVNDAYNANPESMAGALRTLVAMRGDRRTVAVVGEMLELGPTAREDHTRVGELAASLGVDVLLAVGAGAHPAADGARDHAQTHGGGTHAHRVDDLDEAHEWLEAHLRPGDVVLLKSSNSSGLRFLGDRLTLSEARP